MFQYNAALGVIQRHFSLHMPRLDVLDAESGRVARVRMTRPCSSGPGVWDTIATLDASTDLQPGTTENALDRCTNPPASERPIGAHQLEK